MAKFVAVFVFLFVVLSVVAQSDAACEEGGCSKTDIHDSYSINPNNDCTTNGTSNVTATCSTNSTITYPLACNNGAWNATLNESCAMCAGFDVENGNTINGGAINSTARVTCSDGYQLSEDSSVTITCTMDGSWSPTPECESGTIRFVALYCVTLLAVTIAVLMSHQ